MLHTIPLKFSLKHKESKDDREIIGFFKENEKAFIIEKAILSASNIREALPKNTNYINIFKVPTKDNERIIEFNFSNEYIEVLYLELKVSYY